MKPIHSKRELAEARRSLHDLRHQLATLRKAYRHDKAALKEASKGLRQLVRETKRAIVLYEQAQADELPAVVDACNPLTAQLELPRVLRLLRQSAQLGQTELAERLETRQANISRWEREGYDGYLVRQLQRIAEVLGYELHVSFVRTGKKKRRAQ